MVIIELISLLLAGVLAGEELIVRAGVQPALRTLPDLAHVRARQALVRRLRVVVPAIMIPAVIAAIVLLIVGWGAPGFVFRILGVAALVAFLLFSFLGTVPINIRVNDWDAEHPPADWKAVVHRWEVIDVFRSSAAMLAFVFLLVSALLR